MNINTHLLQRATALSKSARALQGDPGIFHAPGRVDSVLWVKLEMLATQAERIQIALYRKASLDRAGVRNITAPFMLIDGRPQRVSSYALNIH